MTNVHGPTPNPMPPGQPPKTCHHKPWLAWLVGAGACFLSMIFGVAIGIVPAPSTVNTVDDTTTTEQASDTTNPPTTDPSPSTDSTGKPGTGQNKPTTSNTPTDDAAPSYTAGTYMVGKDIPAGMYETTGPGEGLPCMWQRLSGVDGSWENILGSSIVEGQATMRIKKGDKAVKFSGECAWTPSS